MRAYLILLPESYFRTKSLPHIQGRCSKYLTTGRASANQVDLTKADAGPKWLECSDRPRSAPGDLPEGPVRCLEHKGCSVNDFKALSAL